MMKRNSRNPVMMLLCIALIFMGLLTVRPSITYACSCVMPAEPLEALENSAAVFTGKVVDIKEPKGTIISSADLVKVTFEVETSWKGVEGKTAELTTELSSASCGFEFIEGESYLVYAGDGGEPKGLKASLCSRTVQFSSAGEDLKELGPGIPSVTPTESPGTGAGTDVGAGNNRTFDPEENTSLNSRSLTLVNVGISGVIVVLIAIIAAVLYRRKN